MSPTGAELRDRIKTLLDANDAEPADVDDVLTAGYGYALSLDSQRLRGERRITELAAHADDPEAAAELRRLWLRNRTVGSELAELRELLRKLRATQLAKHAGR
jgi:hypothetical protein